MDIYVVDTETTGLDGTQYGDKIIEIAVCKLNTKNGKISGEYNSLVGYSEFDENAWVFQNTELIPDMVRWAPQAKNVIDIIQHILKNKYVTSYNIDFDFNRFLIPEPWKIPYRKLMPCIMQTATDVCEIPRYDYYGQFDGYKWPSLFEAYSMLIKDDGKHTPKHRAMSDCYAATLVLRELIKKNIYNYEINLEGKKLWLQKVKLQFNNIRARKQSH